jgi:hypothetical protein
VNQIVEAEMPQAIRDGQVIGIGLDQFLRCKTILKWKKWIRMDQNPMIFWVILSHVEPYSRTYVFPDQFSRPQKEPAIK